MERIALRDAFVAPDPRKVLIAGDYRQMELRIAAHYGNDEALMSLLVEPNGDVFRDMWAAWHSTEAAEVDDDERNIAKSVCYGMLYGMSSATLARELQCTELYADELIQSFHEAFPGVQRFITNTVQQATEHGFVTTFSGRCRNLPNLKSSNESVRAAAERQAVNTICQGSAADVMKLAMIAIDTAIRDQAALTPKGPMADVSIVLQIHDELLLQVDPENLLEVAKIVRACMENAIELTLPMPVKLLAGRSWGSLEKIEEFAARLA